MHRFTYLHPTSGQYWQHRLLRGIQLIIWLLIGIIIFVVLPWSRPTAAQVGSVAPEQPVQWQPVTVSFAGPSASEMDDEPNPFLDYRLQVTFTGPSGQTYDVPGFFDGDGDGGANGDVWRVRFSPDEAGSWSYTASFRTGDDIAVNLESDGTATSFDGATGSFSVAPRDADAPGFLKWGRLEYVDEHYLKFRDGPYFIKGGTDSPENFLGYAGFDGTVDQGGIVKNFLHEYATHVDDWNSGDPDWGNGAGKGIVGALNYLSEQQVNSIYFLPMNLGGDGQETYPFVGATKNAFDKTHYDISKLSQWNTVFDHAQRRGIKLHFVLAETEAPNEQWLDDGSLGVERKLFFRELIARFGYVLAIKWNLSEENDYAVAQLREFADYIQALDPYDHPIAVHTHPNNFQDYNQIKGEDRFAATSIQYNPDKANDHVEQWRTESAEAGQPWVIDMDENSPAGTGLTDDNADDLRKRVLYDVYFSGGNIEWYAGYHDLPLGGDMRLEDFRTREAMWQYMWYARRFMQENLPFWTMEPADDLLDDEASDFGGGQVFAQPGEVYALYLPKANPSGSLDLSDATGEFELRWFNPRTGDFEGATTPVDGGGVIDLGEPPSNPGEDWVVLVRTPGSTGPTPEVPTPTTGPLPGGDNQVYLPVIANPAAEETPSPDQTATMPPDQTPSATPDTTTTPITMPTPTSTPDGGSGDQAFQEQDGLLVVEIESAPTSDDWVRETSLSGYTGAAYYTWDGPNRYNAPGSGVLTYRINITTPGTYNFRMHNRHDFPDSTLANDVFVKLNDGDWVKTFSPRRGEWTWTTRHEFGHNDKPLAEYTLDAGVHALQFSGRSNGFSIDRFVLYLDGVDGEDTNLPESPQKAVATD